MSKIIKFTPLNDLKEKIERLRKEISDKYLERDTLIHHTCKNIEAEYILLFGNLEYKAYESELKYRRLKRKFELIMIRKNRKEEINIDDVEKLLDQEFVEYKKKLEKLLSDFDSALEFLKSPSLSEKNSQELKSLYKKLVKLLHPDLNPNQTETMINLFIKAVDAFEKGDLETLKMIYEIVKGESNIEKIENPLHEIERLKDTLNRLDSDIEKIKSNYPYTLIDVLKSEENKEKRKVELEDLIERYNSLIKVYEGEIGKYV